jgi:hypothetical protein
MSLRITVGALLLFAGLLLASAAESPLDASGFAPGREQMLTDFTSNSSDLGWYVVNDNVMGGRSTGSFELGEGNLRFAGRTNTNGGGFSSIRTKPLRLDLSNHAGLRVRVRGDGRRYTWRLTTAARWRGRVVSYWADFDTQSGTWKTIDIAFASFVPTFRGSQLDGPALDPGEITGMGLMIYDKLDGPFELDISSVHAYAASEPFTLEQYQWNKRVLVISAPAEDDENLRLQQKAVDSTRAEFDDRDMVLVTLLDDGTSTAGERELAADEAATVRRALGLSSGSFALRLIGKDGDIKLESETGAAMEEVYALIDSMPMRRRELLRQPGE